MLVYNIEAQIPDVMAQPGVNVRKTFQASVENRMRWRMHFLRERLGLVTKYRHLADDFEVHRETIGDVVNFRVTNSHNTASIFLHPEVIPEYEIVQEAHWIPIGKLIDWAYGLDVVSPVGLARYTREKYSPMVDDPLMLHIEHPGFEVDEQVLNEIHDAEDDMGLAVTAAMDKWMERFGTQEVS